MEIEKVFSFFKQTELFDSLLANTIPTVTDVDSRLGRILRWTHGLLEKYSNGDFLLEGLETKIHIIGENKETGFDQLKSFISTLYSHPETIELDQRDIDSFIRKAINNYNCSDDFFYELFSDKYDFDKEETDKNKLIELQQRIRQLEAQSKKVKVNYSSYKKVSFLTMNLSKMKYQLTLLTLNSLNYRKRLITYREV